MLLGCLTFNSKAVVYQLENTDQTIIFSVARASAEEIEPQNNDSERRQKAAGDPTPIRTSREEERGLTKPKE